MRALLDDLSQAHNVDAVRIANGGEAVGDDKARPVYHEAFKRFLNEALCLRVDAGGGFVEKKNWGILE